MKPTPSKDVAPHVAYLRAYLPHDLIGATTKTHKPLGSLHTKALATTLCHTQGVVGHDMVDYVHIDAHSISIAPMLLAKSAQGELFTIAGNTIKPQDIILTTADDSVDQSCINLQLSVGFATGNTLKIGNLFHNRTI